MQDKEDRPALSPEPPGAGFPEIFVRLLGFTVLIYYLRVPREALYEIPVIVLSWAVMLWPARFWLLVAWSVSYLAVFYLESPVYSNFLTNIAFCQLTVAAVLVAARVRVQCRKAGSAALEKCAAAIRAAVLWMIFITYFFGAFHKLNDTFLDPSQSAAMPVVRAMMEDDYPVFLGWLKELAGFLSEHPGMAIYGTIGFEFGIAILLLFPRLQPVAFLLDLLMHFFFGGRMWPISTNFPLLMMAAFSVLWDDRNLRLPGWTRVAGRPPWLQAAVLSAGLAFFLAGGFAWEWRSRESVDAVLGWFRSLSYLALFLVFAVAVVRGLMRSRTGSPKPAPWWRVRVFHDLRPAWLLLLPLLFAVNALAPYTGFKTRTSMEMYSDLEVRDGRNNHLFMPARLIVFPYTAQWVEPLESNVYEIQGRIYHGNLIAGIEIRRILAEEPGAWVKYRRNGEVYDSREKGEEARKLNEPPAWWERRFVNLLPPERE